MQFLLITWFINPILGFGYPCMTFSVSVNVAVRLVQRRLVIERLQNLGSTL